MTSYEFKTRENGYEWNTPLTLIWEVNGSPMSDDYLPDEIEAVDLLRKWADRYEETDGWVSIAWFVESVDLTSGVLEGAPFQSHRYPEFPDMDNFLTVFTWPVDSSNGEPLNWFDLPIEDGAWNERKSTKGGFIQEATGWKPAHFQDRVHVPTLFAAARLTR